MAFSRLDRDSALGQQQVGGLPLATVAEFELAKLSNPVVGAQCLMDIAGMQFYGAHCGIGKALQVLTS